MLIYLPLYMNQIYIYITYKSTCLAPFIQHTNILELIIYRNPPVSADLSPLQGKILVLSQRAIHTYMLILPLVMLRMPQSKGVLFN